MTRAVGQLGAVGAVLAGVAACGVPSASYEDRLKTSFLTRIQQVPGVEAFTRTGDEATFTHPGSDGHPVRWRVSIDAVVIEGEGPAPPARGDVDSSWYADGEPVEPLGSMSRLPNAFLEAGVAQQCYARWDRETDAWGW